MTFAATTIDAPAAASSPSGRPGALRRFGQGLGAMLETIGRASQGARCAEYAQRLQAMSDAELAARGIRREDIIRHAFRSILIR